MMDAIWNRLPHRYPFLFVDRVLEVDPGKSVRAIKNVSINEPFFSGHFPGFPVMPGVLLIEAMAQVAALALEAQDDNIGLLAGVDGARFKRPVVPGDQLLIESIITGFKSGVGKAEGRVTVEGELAAKASILFAVRPRSAMERPGR